MPHALVTAPPSTKAGKELRCEFCNHLCAMADETHAGLEIKCSSCKRLNKWRGIEHTLAEHSLQEQRIALGLEREKTDFVLATSLQQLVATFADFIDQRGRRLVAI